MTRDVKKIRAVHENDIENILRRFNLLKDFEEGRVLCKFCKTPTNVNNLYSFIPESGMLNIVCEKAECVNQLMQYVEEKNKKKKEQ